VYKCKRKEGGSRSATRSTSDKGAARDLQYNQSLNQTGSKEVELTERWVSISQSFFEFPLSQSLRSTMATLFTRAANTVQKTAVVGLIGMFSYHTYQISKNLVASTTVKHKTMESTYFEDVQNKVESEYQEKYGKTDKRDWYDKEDQSYLKDVPRGGKPKPVKEGQQQ
jgi:hypothetical protein